MFVKHGVDGGDMLRHATDDFDGVVGQRGLSAGLLDALSKKGQDVLSLLIRFIQRVQSLLRAVERAMKLRCPYSQFSRPR